MMQWSDDSDMTPIEAWMAAVKRLAAKHSAEMNARCVRDFNETVKRAEEEETRVLVTQLIYDVFGPRTWEVSEPRTLAGD